MAFDLKYSYDYCKKIAVSHYENFPVASLLIPSEKRKYIFAVYAFARIADDIADEGSELFEKRIAELTLYKNDFIQRSNVENYLHFPAVYDTIEKYNLSEILFTNLIEAFIQDNEKFEYQNFAEVLEYCKKSANPVGRIVLQIFDHHDQEMFRLSDLICTALQLTNFWQDLSIDLRKGRCYLPQDEMQQNQISFNELKNTDLSPALKELLKIQIDRTGEMFDEGQKLILHLKGLLKLEIKLTILGGKSILRKIKKLDYNILLRRPKLNILNKIFLFIKMLFV